MLNRSVAKRHMAAAASVSHGLRNLLAPARLRLDVWLLRGADGAVGGDDIARMRVLLHHIAQIVDGLDLLRLEPTDQPAVGSTPWPDAVRALLVCIAEGAPCALDIEGDGDALPKIPQLLVTHLVAELALVSQGTAPGSAARYSVGVQGDVVRVRALFSGVAPHVLDPLAYAIKRAVHDGLHAGEGAAPGSVEVDERNGEVSCLIELPAVRELSARGSAVAPTVDCPFSILCIDDNEHLLDALEERLRQANGFSHFLRSRTVTDAITQLDHKPVSLVLLDVHLATSHDPFESISLLRARHPNARVALFSGRADPGLMARAMEHGADGFVFKGMESHDLVSAIVRLARGESVWLVDDE